MKTLLGLTIALLTIAPIWAKDGHECREHPYSLVLEEHGFEHVNHTLLINGKTPIKELEEAMWFIEKIKCAPNGFEIEASHMQYNEPEKQKFLLKILSSKKYELSKVK